ncbi:MAG: hypothetical protein WB853_16450 [Desulfobacterales bacterium]
MRNFLQVQGTQGMARRQTVLYAAQAIPPTCHVFSVIDDEIAEKGHLWTENRESMPDLTSIIEILQHNEKIARRFFEI